MNIRLAEEWLHSCSGCEIAFLNIGEPLIELLAELEIVHMPILMDHKYYGQCGEEQKSISIPRADIGLVSGGVANVEQLDVLFAMREKCNTLIGLGTCATHGGIPAMLNQWSVEEGFETIFHTVTTDPCTIPDDTVPPFLDRVYAVDEKVKVDVYLPGCPPNPQMIASVIHALMRNERLELPVKSVCDTCPTICEGKGESPATHRFFDNAVYKAGEPINKMRCLLEQGLMCMGPVTVAGCAHDGIPRCISARVPCRGCFGPVRRQGNQMLDMMNALASNGLDFKSIVDRKSLLRFSGAHGHLRPLKKQRGA